jgi:hypothetical protein
MPTLSASDYTQFLKYQAAQLAYANGAVPKTVQTTSQPAATVGVMNSYLKTSQAAFVTNAASTNLTGLARVRRPGPNIVNNPNVLSTLSYSTGGTLGPSRISQPGGLPGPAKSSQATYIRLPQNAGW